MMEKNRRDVLKLSGIAALGASGGLSASVSAAQTESDNQAPTENPLHGTLSDLLLINNAREEISLNLKFRHPDSDKVASTETIQMAAPEPAAGKEGGSTVEMALGRLGAGPFELVVSDSRGTTASSFFPMPEGGFGGSTGYMIVVRPNGGLKIFRRWV